MGTLTHAKQGGACVALEDCVAPTYESYEVFAADPLVWERTQRAVRK